MPRDWESRIDEAVEAGDHRSQYPANAGGSDPLLFDVRLECSFETVVRVEAETAHEAAGRARRELLRRVELTGEKRLVAKVVSTTRVKEVAAS
jgi:uncharacterized protein with von Willebrand factor type A (vWA) domain